MPFSWCFLLIMIGLFGNILVVDSLLSMDWLFKSLPLLMFLKGDGMKRWAVLLKFILLVFPSSSSSCLRSVICDFWKLLTGFFSCFEADDFDWISNSYLYLIPCPTLSAAFTQRGRFFNPGIPTPMFPDLDSAHPNYSFSILFSSVAAHSSVRAALTVLTC